MTAKTPPPGVIRGRAHHVMLYLREDARGALERLAERYKLSRSATVARLIAAADSAPRNTPGSGQG